MINKFDRIKLFKEKEELLDIFNNNENGGRLINEGKSLLSEILKEYLYLFETSTDIYFRRSWKTKNDPHI